MGTETRDQVIMQRVLYSWTSPPRTWRLQTSLTSRGREGRLGGASGARRSNPRCGRFALYLHEDAGEACWGPKRWRESCCTPMVLMDESAENVVAADLRPGYRLGTRSGIGRLKVEAPMRSGPIVVLGVRAEDALQVAPAEDKDVVEAFSSNRADPSLGERVRPRRTDGCLHRRESFRSKHFIEGTWELCVSVPEQDVLALKVSRDREVPSLLGDPGRVGSAGGAGEMDSPRGELDEEQDVEGLQEHGLDGEEVARQHSPALCSQELAPGRTSPTRRRSLADTT